jgi:hypothetical protein
MGMINELSMNRYSGAIELITKWRVVPAKYFSCLLGDSRKRSARYYFLNVLKEEKIISKVRLNRSRGELVIPSRELMEHFNLSLNREQFDHDTVVSYVASAFLEMEAFKEGDITFEHEVEKFSFGSVIPDIMLVGRNPRTGKEFKMAVEIEISRKAFSKIDGKISRYVSDDVFDVVLYLFTKKDLYELFKRRFSEYENHKFRGEVEDKIALALLEDFTNVSETLLNSKCYFAGREGVLSDHFKRGE